MQEAKRALEMYKVLWNNRSLETSEGNEEEALLQAIRRELKDELTHPRTRKTPLEKYFLAIKRIIASSLDYSDQHLLIKTFTYMLEELKKES